MSHLDPVKRVLTTDGGTWTITAVHAAGVIVCYQRHRLSLPSYIAYAARPDGSWLAHLPAPAPAEAESALILGSDSAIKTVSWRPLLDLLNLITPDARAECTAPHGDAVAVSASPAGGVR
ncbi:hypothetical protein ACIBKY_51245 [Nonomuraea sp. NPDC050394]|uniref:hypothetical protein n=1 Tax=Nonomuraea sp. NPDC050394 TaxID=3364363 RepID=UPI0037B6A179